MVNLEYSVFMGKEIDAGFSGFVTESNFYLILQIEEGSKNQGELFLKLIVDRVARNPIKQLADLDKAITETIHGTNLPLDISVAAIYTQGTVAYLKTVGEGTIFLRRGSEFAKIISGNTDASGHIKENDLYILTTPKFTSLFPSLDKFKELAISSDVFSMSDVIYEHINEDKDNGIVTLFISPLDHSQNAEAITETVVAGEIADSHISISKKTQFKFPFSFKIPTFSKLSNSDVNPKKKATFLIVGILLVVLIWSVGLGYQRRTESERLNKITMARGNIERRLDQAEVASSLDMNRANELIKESKTELSNLKQALGDSKQKEVAELEQLIAKKEAHFTNKEEKSYQEFYDIAVDTKDAKSDIMYATGDSAIILDSSKGAAYIVSLSKKSLEKRVVAQLKKATLINYYEDSIYMFDSANGVFRIGSDSKAQKVIATDNDWADITGMEIFNGNIYLLDTGNNEVYKYAASGSSFSSKESYFKADVDINDATSIAIDSSLYLSFPDKVLKYNGGLPTSFSTQYPGSDDLAIQKVFTHEDIADVYIWSKKNGVIYIVEKDGAYKEQIQSSILSKATDFAVEGSTVYILSNNKIYSISL